MDMSKPTELTVIAGRGNYPLLLAEAARKQGVTRLAAIAFRGETDRALLRLVDEVHWVHIGQLTAFLKAVADAGCPQAVMAGQITPTHLFRVRLDRAMLAMLKQLPRRNAETIFGAVGEAMRDAGAELLPASLFMEAHMPAAGILTRFQPTAAVQSDIAFGMQIATTVSDLDIGQTVVIKDGTVLAVEAFEGTNAAIRRAAKLAGPGVVVAKAAKPGHDMRFDIPVVGEQTIQILKKVRAAAIAVQAGRSILLGRKQLAAIADAHRICMVAVKAAPDTEPGENE